MGKKECLMPKWLHRASAISGLLTTDEHAAEAVTIMYKQSGNFGWHHDTMIFVSLTTVLFNCICIMCICIRMYHVIVDFALWHSRALVIGPGYFENEMSCFVYDLLIRTHWWWNCFSGNWCENATESRRCSHMVFAISHTSDGSKKHLYLINYLLQLTEKFLVQVQSVSEWSQRYENNSWRLHGVEWWKMDNQYLDLIFCANWQCYLVFFLWWWSVC